MVIIQTFSLKPEEGEERKRNGLIWVDEPGIEALVQARESTPDAKIVASFSVPLVGCSIKDMLENGMIDEIDTMLKSGVVDEVVVVSL